MEDRLTLVKWVNGETKYFPEDIYEARFVGDNVLQIMHKPSNTISMQCSMSKVIYVRFHMPKKDRTEDNSNS